MSSVVPRKSHSHVLQSGNFQYPAEHLSQVLPSTFSLQLFKVERKNFYQKNIFNFKEKKSNNHKSLLASTVNDITLKLIIFYSINMTVTILASNYWIKTECVLYTMITFFSVNIMWTNTFTCKDMKLIFM